MFCAQYRRVLTIFRCFLWIPTLRSNLSEPNLIPDRRVLIGKPLKPASYTVAEVDVDDFLGVIDEPLFNELPSSTSGVDAGAAAHLRLAPPSFAPFVAVLGLLRTFDWGDDFGFDYKTGTAMFGEQFIEFGRPLVVGETVDIKAEICDVYEKKGKSLFDVVEVSFSIIGQTDSQAVMSGKQSYILFK